jgi:hypothetical protein
MTADTHALHRSVAELGNLEGPEEEFVAEDSPIRYFLPGQSFKLTAAAAICLLPLKCCVTWERLYVNRFSICLTKENIITRREQILEFSIDM